YIHLQSIFDAGFPDGRKYYQKSGLVSALTPRAIGMLLDVFQTPRSYPLTVQLQGMGGAAHRVKPVTPHSFTAKLYGTWTSSRVGRILARRTRTSPACTPCGLNSSRS